eukprot:2377464-Amphidinium_carterae.1
MLSADRILNPTKQGVEEGSTTSGLQMNMPTFCCWSRGRFYYIIHVDFNWICEGSGAGVEQVSPAS